MAKAPKKHPGQIAIPIRQATLQNNTTYFISETLPFCRRCSNKAYWTVNKRSRRRAYVQKGWYYASYGPSGYSWISTSSGPWTLQNWDRLCG